ncbi:uncharacterized protein LOC134266104 [Saccostrea cucullata]|uniref:uncharacterized protein LOC134266104 n=1 Tax=Saccostrea cuccullata TaxID=36930 RepID=UPI002ED5F52F
MGDVCSSTENLEKGTRVIVSVIESEKAIKNEKYECDKEIFNVVYKLWDEVSVPEERRKGRKHDHEKIKEINSYLKKNADSICRQHSNIEIIRGSLVRIKTNKAKKVQTISEPCIAIYCSYKGVVPIGEKEFPRVMDGYATDIREGFFHLHKNYDIYANSDDLLEPLRMGASISKDQDGTGKGTLGGFVELKNGRVGFLTCAHIFHNAEEMMQRPLDIPFPIVQPSASKEGSQRCGKILKSAFPFSTIVDGVSVDATVVELTERVPDRALFANLTTARLKTLGLSRSRIPRVCCGKMRSMEEAQDRPNEKALKCGMESGLTLGGVEESDSYVRLRNISPTGQRFYTMYMSQLAIRGRDGTRFSKKGDSGALVFQFKDLHNLKCIGMVVGEGGGFSYATPITSVLEALKVKLKDFQSKIKGTSIKHWKKYLFY